MSSKQAKSTSPDTEPLGDRIRARLVNSRKVLHYAFQRADEKKLTQVAASLTYTTVLAIVPMLAVVLSLFTAFPLFADFKGALEGFLTSNLMPPTVSDSVMGYLNQFAAKASGLTAVGTIALMVVSIMLIMTIDSALNSIWNVQRQRPLRQRILVYWAIISLGPILAGATLWTTTMLGDHPWARLGGAMSGLSALLTIIQVLVTSVGFAALFVIVPNRQVYWRDALAGGLGTAIVLTLMKNGFAYYIAQFPTYTIIYGAFATLPIFLLWIYLSWLGILFGATVAATLPSLRLRRWEENRQKGAPFVDAINIVSLLRSAQSTPSPGRSSRFLSDHLRLHTDELLLVLKTLREIGYVVPTQDQGIDQWVLACDISEARLGRLVDAFLIDRSQMGVVDRPQLLDAIAASLSYAPDLTLETVLAELARDASSEPDGLPQTDVMRQNTPTGTQKPIQETHHVESQ